MVADSWEGLDDVADFWKKNKGKALGSAFGGAFGGIVGAGIDASNDSPEYQGEFKPTNLSPEGEALANDYVNRSEMSAGDIEAQGLIGTGQRDEFSQSGALGGEPDKNMADALSSRINQMYSQGTNDYQRGMRNQAELSRGRRLAEAVGVRASQSSLARRDQQLANQMFQMKSQAYLNRQASRNTLIRSLFSGGGAAAGLAFGGPAGGMAGSAAGGMAGNAVAGGNPTALPTGGENYNPMGDMEPRN